MDTNSKINSPLVSILMLTYNRAHLINEAVLSVLNQDYINWELVIIDDGSTDHTASIIKNYDDTRIHYIKHEDNAGLYERRKESLTCIKGEYTAVLDSDDFWNSSDKLSKQVNFLEQHKKHALVGTMTNLIDFQGQIIGQQRYASDDPEIRKKILIRNQFTHSSLLFRSDLVNKTEGYLPTLAEDLELVLQLGKLGKLANLNSFDTTHRVHKESQNDHGLKMAKAVHKIILKHQSDYPNRLKAVAFSFTRLLHGYIKSFIYKS